MYFGGFSENFIAKKRNFHFLEISLITTKQTSVTALFTSVDTPCLPTIPANAVDPSLRYGKINCMCIPLRFVDEMHSVASVVGKPPVFLLTLSISVGFGIP